MAEVVRADRPPDARGEVREEYEPHEEPEQPQHVGARQLVEALDEADEPEEPRRLARVEEQQVLGGAEREHLEREGGDQVEEEPLAEVAQRDRARLDHELVVRVVEGGAEVDADVDEEGDVDQVVDRREHVVLRRRVHRVAHLEGHLQRDVHAVPQHEQQHEDVPLVLPPARRQQQPVVAPQVVRHLLLVVLARRERVAHFAGEPRLRRYDGCSTDVRRELAQRRARRRFVDHKVAGARRPAAARRLAGAAAHHRTRRPLIQILLPSQVCHA